MTLTDAVTTVGERPRHDPEPAVPLAGDWSLQRDFALRSAGFPVSGLDVFGPGDESGRLRAVAAQPRLREAVTWQNPAALANAVDKVAAGAPASPSRARQREQIVASYWQRYCAKNDTIGFFGPLAWGRVADTGPALTLRAGVVEHERAVHLESWGVQALAETLDPDLRIAAGPRSEDDLRTELQRHRHAGVRDAGLAALDRLVAARDAVAVASPDGLREALARLDAVFVELTGRAPSRNAGRAYGARTLAYSDCMRDVDITLGPGLVADLAPALQALFEATRWYCGQVHEIGRAVLAASLPPSGHGPFMPVLGRCLGTLMQLPDELHENVAEFDRRFGALLADPDPATIGARAVATFADARPAWRFAALHSVDVQLAAPSAAAVADGDYLAVVGDVHPGNDPLRQGVFAHRHPDPGAFTRGMAAAAGAGIPWLLPPYGPGLGVDARGVGLTAVDDIHIAVMPDGRAQLPRRTWLAQDLMVQGEDVVDRAGELRVPVVDVMAMAFFVAGVRTFELLPDVDRAPRLTVGRTVVRRASWSVPAAEIPERPADVAAFAADRGMPRRVFVKSPLERKPMYLDIESPVLARILCRHARQAAADTSGARMRFSEMLPAPDECWLTDPDGGRYVSELRLTAVDRRACPVTRP